MSKCYNCNIEFTLKPEETRCDNCKKIVNFPCNGCKEWFSIEDTRTCGFCGFYYCPKCHTCSSDCLRYTLYREIRKIIPQITDEQLESLKDYIEELKTNKEQKKCYRGVPISYAKGRCKMCAVRLLGYRCKNQKDLEKFKERFEIVLDKPLGTILTINQSKEDGSYGQEYRDVFNLTLCMGKLKKIQVKRIIDGKEVGFEAYQRIEEGNCRFFDIKDLIVKQCPNENCKMKIYPFKETHCCMPECRYTKDTKKHKKGDFKELMLKISNRDTCQLNRGLFKKDGET